MVVVLVEDKRLVVPVGPGTQSLRWLALAAAQRYGRMLGPRGRLRQRESTPTQGSFVPIGMHRVPDDGSVLSPKLRISDTLREDDEVRVLLRKEAGLEPTRWQMEAFSWTETSRRRLEALEKKKRELDTRRFAEEFRLLSKTMARTTATSSVFDDFHSETAEQLAEAIESDWRRLKLTGIVPDADEKSRVKSVLVTHFVTLRDAFKFYAGLGGSGNPFTVSLNEFTQFTSKCGIMDWERINPASISGVFIATNVERNADGSLAKDDSNPDRELVRFEFIEALLRLAMKKFEGSFADQPSAQLRHLLDAHVVPHVTRLLGNRVREQLRAEAVQAVYRDNLDSLRAVFRHYVLPASRVRPRDYLTLTDYVRLVDDAAISADKLSKRDVKLSFIDSQMDAIGDDDEAAEDKEDSKDDIHMSQMVFVEFLEGLGRLAMLRWPGDTPLAAKVQNMVDLVNAHLLHLPGKRRPDAKDRDR
eukprot:PLAT3014.1.p1 GENE.PLAT3014.1~~PLAT3014.1.p1  ORF type:complete len:474 (+),score=260.16 PLAT3014.1:39-1460(+)